MDGLVNLPFFVAAQLLVTISPGPITLATGSVALVGGFRQSIPLVAGVAVGTAVLVMMVGLGAGIIWTLVPQWVVRWVAIGTLLCFALGTLRMQPPQLQRISLPATTGKLAVAGLVLAFASPGQFIFFTGAIPGFGAGLFALLILALAAALIDIVWYLGLSLVVAKSLASSATLARHFALIRAASAGAFALLAGVLALSTT